MTANRSRRRPLPEGEELFTPGASGLRRAVERRSAAPLLFLHQLPAWALPFGFAAVLVAGFAVRGPGGAAAFAVLAALLGWLSYLSWPSLPGSARLLRVTAIAAVLAGAIYQGSR